MKVKIISDGTAENTRVIDMDTGRDIGNVTAIDWHMDIDNQVSECTLTLVGIPVLLEDVTVKGFPPTGYYVACKGGILDWEPLELVLRKHGEQVEVNSIENTEEKVSDIFAPLL